MLNIRKISLLAALPALLLVRPLSAENIKVAGQLSKYPVVVQATNTGCNGVAPVSFGYSVDNNAALVLGSSAYSIDHTDSSIHAGSHTLHFKSWTKGGICPVVNVAINVSGTAPGKPSVAPSGSGPIPSNAVAAGSLLGSSNWQWNHDGGTPGSSVGYSNYPASPSLDGSARQFYVSYANRGGEIYHLSLAQDAAASHFVYDSWVYITDPSQLKNLEMDVNHVMSNGRTVILGTQCSGYSGTWEYAIVYNGGPHWKPSNIPCNPASWSANTWHHVQIATSHDGWGNASYDWVNVDGDIKYFSGANGSASLALGWAVGDVLINFQLDGANASSGSLNVYADKMTVYRW